jgi:hypothetical protein
MLNGPNITVQGSTISFTGEKLAANRLYNVTVLPSSNGDLFTHWFSISEYWLCNSYTVNNILQHY